MENTEEQYQLLNEIISLEGEYKCEKESSSLSLFQATGVKLESLYIPTSKTLLDILKNIIMHTAIKRGSY